MEGYNLPCFMHIYKRGAIMNHDETDRILDKEISEREKSCDWSSQIVTKVFASVRQGRKKRLIDIASFAFPAAAAAALILVLTFGIDTTDKMLEQYNAGIALSGTIHESYVLSYDEVDYYINKCFSQK